ncbi:MAG: GDSL-type esterase/lipase family protein [Candidatus Nomurabacteria bacterium]|jgi:lysophospholipase L1-like esterase|nr:GDSL-type esterase/lipase family protein [Candidatus Nomurabacteria bacterium]
MKLVLKMSALIIAIITTSAMLVGLQNANAAIWTPPAYRSEKILNITLVGDSYTAGNGAGNYVGEKKSYRSLRNWGHIYANYLNQNNIKVRVTDTSYNGDTTRKVIDSQMSNVPEDTDLVMMTIGGNDVNFEGIIQKCFVPGFRDPSLCDSAIKLAKNGMADVIKRTEQIFIELEKKLNDDAVVVLVAYPYLSMEGVDYKMGYCRARSYVLFFSCADWIEFDAGSNVRSLGKIAVDSQRIMVDRWNKDHTLQIKYIDSIPRVFEGHEPHPAFSTVNERRWINEYFETEGILFNDGKTHSKFSPDINEWYHPNIIGHQKIAEAINTQLTGSNLAILVRLITNEILGATPPISPASARISPAFAPISPLAAPVVQDEDIFAGWPAPIIKTKPASSNTPLQSAWIQCPCVAIIGEPTEIDARASYSLTGDIIRYEWDFNNDGVYEFTSTKPLFSHTFNQEYDGPINLRIVDDAGYTATATGHLSVRPDDGRRYEEHPSYPVKDLPGVFEIIDGVPSIPLNDINYHNINTNSSKSTNPISNITDSIKFFIAMVGNTGDTATETPTANSTGTNLTATVPTNAVKSVTDTKKEASPLILIITAATITLAAAIFITAQLKAKKA